MRRGPDPRTECRRRLASAFPPSYCTGKWTSISTGQRPAHLQILLVLTRGRIKHFFLTIVISDDRIFCEEFDWHAFELQRIQGWVPAEYAAEYAYIVKLLEYVVLASSSTRVCILLYARMHTRANKNETGTIFNRGD